MLWEELHRSAWSRGCSQLSVLAVSSRHRMQPSPWPGFPRAPVSLAERQWPWFQGDMLLVHLWEARKIFHEGNWKVFRLKGTRIGSLLFCRKRPFSKLWQTDGVLGLVFRQVLSFKRVPKWVTVSGERWLELPPVSGVGSEVRGRSGKDLRLPWGVISIPMGYPLQMEFLFSFDKSDRIKW